MSLLVLEPGLKKVDTMVKTQSETLSSFQHRQPRRRGLRLGFVLVALAVALQASPVAAEEDYDPSEAGFPLRVVAYVVNPVGVALDYLIFRPAYWIGSYEPFRTVFGRKD